jgi:hypothetical protein
MIDVSTLNNLPYNEAMWLFHRLKKQWAEEAKVRRAY